MTALHQSNLTSLKLLHRGKVRDLYEVDANHLLIVQTDRLSAFDVILPDPIPGKGEVLTAVSNFWFRKLAHVIPNHLTGIDPESVVKTEEEREQVRGRSFVTKRLKPLPIEAIVRGYLVGSGWKDYKKTGSVCGIALPAGLQEAQKLPEPLFTPSTKAAVGDHDENISFDKARELLGDARAEEVKRATLALYTEAAEYALAKGIIIADTKFEFGTDDDGKLYLIDEALTPDSSRFWPADQYKLGCNQPSFDKQFVRDWLENSGWNKRPPAPTIPTDVLQKTAGKYREALQRLTAQVTAPKQLIEGFRRFRQLHFVGKDALYKQLSTEGQSPKILVVACCDSRVDPALVLDCAPGDLFVIRNVANLVPPAENRSGGRHGTSAALEFGVRNLQVEHIIVLGHAQCGGIRSLFSNSSSEPDSYISSWMRMAGNVHDEVLRKLPSASTEEQMVACEQRAILVSLDNLMTFPWIKERVEQGSLQLHGWYFDIEQGLLLQHDPAKATFEAL